MEKCIDFNIKKKKYNNLIITKKVNLIIGTNSLNFFTNFIRKNFLKLLSTYKNESLKNYFCFNNLKLGEGTYGRVTFGIEMFTKNPVVIKLLKYGSKDKTGEIEKNVLVQLNKNSVLPKLYDLLEYDPNHKYLITSLHGPNLQKLEIFCHHHKFSRKTIYKIGIGLFKYIEFLHEVNYLHLDLKQDNILWLFEPIKINNNTLDFILIDFGFSIKYIDEKGFHIKKSDKIYRKCGNSYFASIDEMKYNNIGRKDDLISIIYIMFNWISPLPWSNLNRYLPLYHESLIESKEKFFPEQIYKSDKILIEFFKEINSLKYSDIPNYEKYRDKLKNEINDENLRFEYDWETRISEIYGSPRCKNQKISLNEKIKYLFD